MAAPINIQANVQIQNLSQLERQLMQATEGLRKGMAMGNNARSINAMSQPLGRLTGQADEFTKSMDAANARVLAFGASVGVLNAFSNAFKSLIASTIEVEKALKAITVVGDQFAGSTKELGQGLFNVAKLTGQSFAEVSKAALEFSRQGLKLEDTLQRTQDALILTRLTGLDSAKAVDGLTAAFNAFSKAGLSTSQILNKLAAVDQAFAVSSADLIEGFNRSAAVAQNAGVSFDELAGIITALQQETSRGGAVIGNALKTIFTRIQDKDTLIKLKELGITVEDVQGKILPARQILQNLAQDVQGLGQVTKSGIFKDVAGAFQINQLISLVGDLNKQNGIAASATEKSAKATNEAYIANEKLNQSLDAILNKVAVSGKQIGSILGDLGISDNLKGLLDGLNSFLESASSVLQGDDIGAKFAQGLVKGIGSVLTGPGVGLFLAIIGKLTYDFIKFSAQGLKTFFNIGQAAKQQQQIQESIVQTLLRNQNVLSQIVNTQGGQNAQAQAFLNILRQEEETLQNIRTLAGGIAAPVIAQGYRTGDQGLRRRSAGGYLPAQEASDVRRGVGGASPSSKVVTIPNFAFGGGKRGTMIANTSEYIVPNYAGGGSAIFNQDMAKTMGLPPGAKKITAASGFVPNFKDAKKTKPTRLELAEVRGFNAKEFNILYGKSFGFPRKSNETAQEYENTALRQFGYIPSNKYLAYKSSSSIDGYRFKGNVLELAEVKADEKSGLGDWNKQSIENKFLRAIGENYNKNAKNQLSVGLKRTKTIIGNLIAPPNILKKKGISAQNITRSSNGYIPNFANTNQDLAIVGLYGENGNIDGSPVYTINSQRPNIFKDIEGNLKKNVTNLVKGYASRIGKKIDVPVIQKGIKKSLTQIPSLSGFMFEDVLNQLAGPNFDTATESSGSRIDFPLTQGLRDVFNITGSQKYAEAKLNPYSSEALKSIREKQLALASGAQVPKETITADIADLKAKWIKLNSLPGRTKGRTENQEILKEIVYGLGLNLTTKKDTLNNQINRKFNLASGGYIPNFASTALQAAISRERSAGVPASQIYIDKSPALQSSANPMGLMVANRRDEPAGGFQGISRARNEGRNPKTYGAANGFVPNFFSLQAPNASQYTAPANSSSSSSPPAAPNPANIEAVNKGFADTAGKIFLLQSAMSFLNGALGEADTSLGRFTQELSNTSANITSLALFGKEIADIKIDGDGLGAKFGRFAKGLGLVGVGFAAVTEGFKLANFAIKEFSGENQRAALEASKLADATSKASLKLEELSQTRQKELEQKASNILGESGFQSMFGKLMSGIFGSQKEAGGDFATDTIKKGTAQILALGGTEKDIQDIIKSGKKTATQKIGAPGYYGTREVTTDITQVSDIEAAFAKSFTEGIGKILNDAVNKFKTGIAGLNPNDTNFELKAQEIGAKSFGKKSFNELDRSQQNLINDQIKQRKELVQLQTQEQKTQNEINFGERLSLEIAKKRVDSVLEIAKLKIQATTEEEAQIQLQEQTLDLSNRQKIINEARLKQLDLEKKKQTDIVDSIATVIDKAQQGGLSIDETKLKDLQKFLEKIDFSKAGTNIDALAGQLEKTYGISAEQAKNLINSVKEEQKAREGINKTTSDQIDAEKNRKLEIDGINQSLASQLSTIDRIASTAASIGNLNISGIDLESAKTKAQITRLQAQLQDPNLTEGQKNTINTEINGLEKVLNLNEKRKASEDKIIKTAEIEGKIKAKTLELEKLRASIGSGPVSEETTQKIKDAEAAIANFNNDLEVVKNTYDSTKLTLDANNAALDIQASLIGKVAGAYASLRKQLEAFRLGAGERIASAQLEAFGATDIDSLAKAGIRAKVEAQAQAKGKNLNDADYYKSIQEGVRLGELRYEQAVAESEVRRRELDYEIKYTEELIALKKKGATEEELIAAKKRQIEEQRSGKRGLERGLDAVQDKINNYRTAFAEEIPQLFSSNLAQGLSEAISGAKSLKDALRDAATSFLNAITQKNIENIANLFTSGIGGTGQALFKANGGMISGGSGTKDDVPAMLMGGEYVIKKSAVKKYGSRFLDSLNNGGVQAFAAGGGVQSGKGGFYVPGDFGTGAITGKNQLLEFAGQSFTGGQYDRMGGFGMSGASISLEPESARLTAYGRENSPIFERVQQAKEEAFNVYLDQLKQESAYQQQLKEINKAEKERKKQLTRAIVSAVASSAISYAGSAMSAGAQNANAAAIASGGKSSFMTGLKGAFTGYKGQGGLGNIFSSNALTLSSDAQFFKSIGVSSSKDLYSGKLSTENYGKLFNQYPNLGKTYNFDYNTRTYRASGGFISGGSGMRDDVPAMLTGGEFVLNNRATRKLGVQNLNRLNAGATESQQSSGGVSDALISKLDELIQTTRESSKDNVVVNVSGMEAGGEKRSDENKSSNDRELQRKIREAVIAVITQEKRLGGSLSK